MKLIVGKKYKRNDNKPMPFGELNGVFTGFTKCGWPSFRLSGTRVCSINATEDSFTEANVKQSHHNPTKRSKGEV